MKPKSNLGAFLFLVWVCCRSVAYNALRGLGVLVLLGCVVVMGYSLYLCIKAYPYYGLAAVLGVLGLVILGVRFWAKHRKTPRK